MAGYVDENLMEGESVVYRTRLHWMVYAWPVLWFVAAIVVAFTPAGLLSILLVFISGAAALGAWIERRTSEFAVTDRRIILKTGLVWRKTTELLLGKVESLDVNQGVVGRLLDYGTITVSGIGQSSPPFKRVEKPMELRRQLYEQVDQTSGTAR